MSEKKGMMLDEEIIRAAIAMLVGESFDCSEEHGFHESGRKLSEEIALQHSELSEVLEADRHGNPPSEKCPGLTQVEEEYADLLIRVFDTAGARGLRLTEALLAKMAVNRARPHKHGKGY